MGYIPIFLDVAEKPCLVLGGGQTAELRVAALRKAQAAITVISPNLTPRLTELAENGAFRYIRRNYIDGDVKGFVLTYAAGIDFKLARLAAQEAGRLGVPINVTDVHELCSFIVPALAQRGRLQVAISTGGGSPALAKLLREEFEASHGPEYGALLEILAAARHYLRVHLPDRGERESLNIALARSPLRDYLHQHDFDATDRLLRAHIGAGLTELGLDAAHLNACILGMADALPGDEDS
jgi:precorrin-2 dehydrogenase/sirohydrochlorin ferrochelatase